MNFSAEKKPAVRLDGGLIRIEFPDGAEIRFPVRGNRRLSGGTERQVCNMVVSAFGIHWPDLDEDLSFEGLARGDYGQFFDRDDSDHNPLSVAESPAAYDAQPDP